MSKEKQYKTGLNFLTEANRRRHSNAHQVLKWNDKCDEVNKPAPNLRYLFSPFVEKIAEPSSVEHRVKIETRSNHAHKTHQTNLKERRFWSSIKKKVYLLTNNEVHSQRGPTSKRGGDYGSSVIYINKTFQFFFIIGITEFSALML